MNGWTASICGLVVATAGALLLGGCARSLYSPERATRPHPAALHSTDTVDIQVFREDTEIELVNATADSYADFDLWLNQRYVRRVEALPAGRRIRLSLWTFADERGELFNAGGFFRTYAPTPVRLVQIQTDEEQPLIGLVTIRSEPAE